MKILVTGGNSQLACCLRQTLLDYKEFIINEYLFASHKELDITFKKSIKAYLDTHKDIKYIINCASYTDVEGAEKDPYTAFYVNSYGVKNLVDVCEERDITLFHFSTDYVYRDNQLLIIDENGDIDPQNIYAQSKRDGEIHILNSKLKNWYIFRISWLYSEYKNNFVIKTIKNIDKHISLLGAKDEIGCPTYAMNVARMLVYIIDYFDCGEYRLENGIYNYCDGYHCSRYEFMRDIISNYVYDMYNVLEDRFKCQPTLKETTQENIYKSFNLKAKRPKYVVMNCDKIMKILNIDDPFIYSNSINECVYNYKLLNW